MIECVLKNMPTERTLGSGLLLIFSMTILLGGANAQAALLDGMLTGVEESLAEKVSKKGEKLKTGNFYTAERPDAHGPIGMMGEHTHDKGEVMFTYRYKQMFMEGNRDGTTQLSDAAVRSLGFMVVPTKMTMEMHMFSGMYGLTDTVTVMVMVPYIIKSMDHARGMPLGAMPPFTTRSEGVGDVRFGSLWRLWAVEAPSIGAHRFHFNFSLSVPTGDIEPIDVTPANPHTRLPYPMHLGSGTWDLYPGITYGGDMGRGSWGLQAIGTIRLGRNKNNFSVGDAYEVTTYGAYEIIKSWLSGSVRFNWSQRYNYDGFDPVITPPGTASPPRVQTSDPNRLGGERLDLLGGVNILFPEIMGLENRLAVEGGAPIYQRLSGPQLETDWMITVGWQGIFN